MVVNINDYKEKKNLPLSPSGKCGSSSLEENHALFLKKREEKLREKAIKKIREEAKNLKW